jgi:ATP-binding cassette subfamily B protein RaxB
VAVELEPEAAEVETIAPVHLSLGQLTSGISGLWSSVAQVCGLLATSQLLIIGFPLIFQLVIDRVIPANSVSLLLAICSCLLALTLLAAICDAVRSWTVLTVANQIASNAAGF